MATSYSGGGQSPSSLGRTIDRVFEDAIHTGEITLSSRKLKDYPQSVAAKYDLADTISTGTILSLRIYFDIFLLFYCHVMISFIL